MTAHEMDEDDVSFFELFSYFAPTRRHLFSLVQWLPVGRQMCIVQMIDTPPLREMNEERMNETGQQWMLLFKVSHLEEKCGVYRTTPNDIANVSMPLRIGRTDAYLSFSSEDSHSIESKFDSAEEQESSAERHVQLSPISDSIDGHWTWFGVCSIAMDTE